MRPGRAPRMYYPTAAKAALAALEASMRPGRAPRMYGVGIPRDRQRLACFNEAGARAPDVCRGRATSLWG